MKTILVCVVVWTLFGTVLVEYAAGIGPGAGLRGGAAGRAAAGSRRSATPGTGLPRNDVGGPNDPIPARAASLQSLNAHLNLPNGTPTSVSGRLSQTTATWGSRGEPFSPAWYAQHPQAWQYTHPHADAFVATTAVALTAWLSMPVVAAGSTGGSPGTEPVAVQQSADTAVAATTADSSQWLGLGVFALNPPGQAEPTRLVQLSVAHDGALRGSYYDLIGDAAQRVQGKVDPSSRRASWSLGSQNPVAFQTSLDDLTRPEGNVTIRLPDGSTSVWQMSQVRK